MSIIFHCEVLARIQSANCILINKSENPDIFKGSQIDEIKYEEAKDTLKIGEIVRTPMPPGLNLDESEIAISNLDISPEEISFRIQSQNSNVSVLDRDPSNNPLNLGKGWSMAMKMPKCVQIKPGLQKSSENGHSKSVKEDSFSLRNSQSISCSTCGGEISDKSMAVNRILPLPNISWRDFSQDWFCLCLDHKHGEAYSEESRESHEKISQADIKPNMGDVLFAPGFILINESVLDTSNIELERDVIHCSDCDAILGDVSNSRNNTWRLWQHAVKITLASSDLKTPNSDALKDHSFLQTNVTETFLDLINGILEETPEVNCIKIILQSPQSSLFVMIMDRSLQTWRSTIDIPEKRTSKILSSSKLNPIKVRKTMFKFLSKEETKKEANLNGCEAVPVNDEVISAGSRLLEYGQTYIPKKSREDKDGWNCSILPTQLPSKSSH